MTVLRNKQQVNIYFDRGDGRNFFGRNFNIFSLSISQFPLSRYSQFPLSRYFCPHAPVRGVSQIRLVQLVTWIRLACTSSSSSVTAVSDPQVLRGHQLRTSVLVFQLSVNRGSEKRSNTCSEAACWGVPAFKAGVDVTIILNYSAQ